MPGVNVTATIVASCDAGDPKRGKDELKSEVRRDELTGLEGSPGWKSLVERLHLLTGRDAETGVGFWPGGVELTAVVTTEGAIDEVRQIARDLAAPSGRGGFDQTPDGSPNQLRARVRAGVGISRPSPDRLPLRVSDRRRAIRRIAAHSGSTR
jgi:hypothetical protein